MGLNKLTRKNLEAKVCGRTSLLFRLEAIATRVQAIAIRLEGEIHRPKCLDTCCAWMADQG